MNFLFGPVPIAISVILIPVSAYLIWRYEDEEFSKFFCIACGVGVFQLIIMIIAPEPGGISLLWEPENSQEKFVNFLSRPAPIIITLLISVFIGVLANQMFVSESKIAKILWGLVGGGISLFSHSVVFTIILLVAGKVDYVLNGL